MRHRLALLPLAAVACGYESYYPAFRTDLLDTGPVVLPCPTAVGAWTQLTLSNQRPTAVSVSFVSSPSCDEIALGVLAPGFIQTWETDSQAVWVVRDTLSGQVLQVVELRYFGGSDASVVVQ